MCYIVHCTLYTCSEYTLVETWEAAVVSEEIRVARYGIRYYPHVAVIKKAMLPRFFENRSSVFTWNKGSWLAHVRNAFL